MKSVNRASDARAGRKLVAKDLETPRQDCPRQNSADWGRHAERFIDAGTEISAAVQLSARAYLFNRVKSAPDLCVQAL